MSNLKSEYQILTLHKFDITMTTSKRSVYVLKLQLLIHLLNFDVYLSSKYYVKVLSNMTFTFYFLKLFYT